MKRGISLILSILLVCGLFSGCQTEVNETTIAPETQIETTQAPMEESKTVTAEAKGFGGTVTVTVTVQGEKVVAVEAVGPDETESIGGQALKTMAEAMTTAGTVEVDGVSGATSTSTAVLSAARQAYAEATGQQMAEAVMKPGTYTASAMGYSKGDMLDVEVTVSETAILDIKVSHQGTGVTSETDSILQSVIDLMIPRIIENQSVEVDAITGATGSSAGVRAAVTAALTEALLAGGSDETAIMAFQSVPAKVTDVTETLTYEVLVVGMGGAGTMAATRAAEVMKEAGQPVSVLAIDKAGKYGGSTAVSLCVGMVNPTQFQNEFNNGEDYIETDVLRAAWLKYTEGDAKEEMVDIFINKSGGVMDWMIYEHGFAFAQPMAGFTPEDIYRIMYIFEDATAPDNNPYIAQYYHGIVEDYTELGGEYMLETEAYEFICDETGAVIGVRAEGQDGTQYEIYADSVVMATGGFAGSGELETELLSNEYYPLKGEWEHYGMKQNDGKMIQAALNIGAGTYNVGVAPEVHNSGVKVTFTDYERNEFKDEYMQDMRVAVMGPTPSGVWSEADIPRDMISYDSSIAVGIDGKRFASESTLAMLNSWISGPYYYSIWTVEDVKALETEGFKDNAFNYKSQLLGYGSPVPNNVPLPHATEIIDRLVEMGEAYKADTLEELAVLMGCDPKVLVETVNTYNGYCANGVDEEFGKEATYLTALGEGPYYAIKGYSFCYATIAGLDVNENFEVLKADGETPIGNLYCAGHDCMGVLLTEKKAYVSYGGISQGWAYTSGYYSGENAANAAMAK